MTSTIIIGAGPAGLCMAKTLLQCDSTADVLILDSRQTIGGVWAHEQLYSTLRTNNVFSTVDFSDFPMDASFGVKRGEHISGEVMHEYLNAYARHFKLIQRIRLNAKVSSVRCLDGGDPGGERWEVVLDTGELLRCGKVVVATGILSEPYRPSIEGEETLDAPFIHSSELGRQSDEMMGSRDIKTIAVVGGSKSAYDAVYLAASTGHKVEWIIRESGRGPTWVFPAYTFLGPFKALRESLLTRRIVSFMSPWVFPDASGFGWLRRVLHFSRIGKAIPQRFWAKIQQSTLRDCQYRQHDELSVLEPEQNPFWYGTSSGVFNYPVPISSFLKTSQVRVHRADITHISPHTLHLSSKSGPTSLPIDAIIACTGYSPLPPIAFPSALHFPLGIPTTSLTPSQAKFWSIISASVDLTMSKSFPCLFFGPTSKAHQRADSPNQHTPWRLYRGIAPPGLTADGDHSLVFLNMASGTANTPRIEIQCLWAVAYLKGEMEIDETRVWQDTALLQRFAELRAPYGHGRWYIDFVADQVPYWDLLVGDLGLETRRKGGWRELFAAYGGADYRGLVGEWLAKRSKLGQGVA
ncbi:hypothetical protein OQA88_8899 [Cercophora sp. LCS_1]